MKRKKEVIHRDSVMQKEKEGKGAIEERLGGKNILIFSW